MDPEARPRRRRGTPGPLGAVAGILLLATGCATSVEVSAAPYAADPVCAEVSLSLPQVLGGLERQRTTSQATAAWGGREAAVALRCGVEPPGPTTTECIAVTGSDGTALDWLAEQTADGGWLFTTYGRSPAVEVHVPAGAGVGVPTEVLVDLSAAVSRTEPTSRRCY